MSDFANLADGGARLAPALREALDGCADPVLLPVLPNGVPVVAGIRSHLALPVVALAVERSDAGVRVPAVPDLAGRTAVVIDDGVETGTVARAVVAPLREAGVARLVLAVPVCSREALVDLEGRYDEVVAVVRPLVLGSLAGHYADFDTVDEAQAHRILAELPA